MLLPEQPATKTIHICQLVSKGEKPNMHAHLTGTCLVPSHFQVLSSVSSVQFQDCLISAIARGQKGERYYQQLKETNKENILLRCNNYLSPPCKLFGTF